MTTELGNQMLVLKFLAASILLIMLPVAVGGTAQALAALAIALLAVTMVVVVGASTETAGRSPASWRDRTTVGKPCGHSAPDAAGHVQARAPGRGIGS
ncbi:hypothetical protein [Nocardia terpenica]|uniref:Uncharacterized protein n=1 Tax=Nocardia terpenica TaxID=455432 RepID=A0A6G9Z2U2_9NOCA|nr:hypothetical protein [Nocardia terpenica]QIS19506.1 hypothetical protein F6W96_15670 [Nocardia terpenica]